MLPSDGAIAAVTCQRRWLANVDRDRFARDWGSAYRCKHISAGSSTWVGMLHRRICIYSRSGTFDDFSDDVPGCRWGSHDVGSLLVVVNTFGLTFVLTWPLVLLSLVPWIMLLVRRLKRPAV